MSALGQKRTCAVHKVMSALPSKADMCSAQTHVRFVPIATIALQYEWREKQDRQLVAAPLDERSCILKTIFQR